MYRHVRSARAADGALPAFNFYEERMAYADVGKVSVLDINAVLRIEFLSYKVCAGGGRVDRDRGYRQGDRRREIQ